MDDWRNDPVTESQVDYLQQLGYSRINAVCLTKGEACDEIQRRKQMPSNQQIKFLRAMRWRDDAILALSRTQATEVIGRIVAQTKSKVG
jgi:hypothetical protein